MAHSPGTVPFGTDENSGISHRRSPFSVADTVQRLGEAIDTSGAKVFAVIDHSGEAQRVGALLRDTKLVIFGNPKGGTPLMVARPLMALDLPLKVLVWADDRGEVWMSYLSAEWLADRHHLAPELGRPLSAVDILTSRVATPGSPSSPP